MAERNFSTSRWGRHVFNATRSRRLSVATLGESHGTTYLAYAIQYACARYYHADITFDYRDYASGGQMFALGGTTTTGANGLTTQATLFANRPADIAFIASGYNDQPTHLTAPTVAATVQTVAQSLFTSGALIVVIMGMTPWAGWSVSGWETYNNLMRNWCRDTPGAIFLDITPVLADMAAASGTMAYRLTGAVQGGFARTAADNTHWSGNARRLIAPLIADVFRSIAPERRPRASLSSGAYDPANKPWISLTGDAGNCLGTSGQPAGGNVAGTGGASRIWLSATGSTTFTPSIVTGALGERKQRIEPATGPGTVILELANTITNPNNGDTSRRFDFECVIDLVGVTGLAEIMIKPLNNINYATPNDVVDMPQLWPDNTTESLFYYSLFPFPITANNPSMFILPQFAKTPSGAIEFSRMSCQRVV